MACRYGITPAYAGRRKPSTGTDTAGPDHPRVRGEKVPLGASSTAAQGSPPRTRGEDEPLIRIPSYEGITPAYAGRSRRFSFSRCYTRDHPRVRGEKTHSNEGIHLLLGSPPRTRGEELL